MAIRIVLVEYGQAGKDTLEQITIVGLAALQELLYGPGSGGICHHQHRHGIVLTDKSHGTLLAVNGAANRIMAARGDRASALASAQA
jgi:hypothetical protein